MLGFLVDLHLRMVGAEVAFAAGLGLAGLRDREPVPRMAGAAAARAPVGVDPADTGIWPSRGIELAVRQHLHGRAVALQATDGNGRRTTDDFAEEIVERGKNLAGLGVMAAFLLVHFVLVAASAVFRRHDDGDRRAVMLKGITVGFFRLVAVVAADAFLPVGAGQPFLGKPWIERAMALETGIVLLCVFAAGRGSAPLGHSLIDATDQRKSGKQC